MKNKKYYTNDRTTKFPGGNDDLGTGGGSGTGSGGGTGNEGGEGGGKP